MNFHVTSGIREALDNKRSTGLGRSLSTAVHTETETHEDGEEGQLRDFYYVEITFTKSFQVSWQEFSYFTVAWSFRG